jgi:hypothetical protein
MWKKNDCLPDNQTLPRLLKMQLTSLSSRFYFPFLSLIKHHFLFVTLQQNGFNGQIIATKPTAIQLHMWTAYSRILLIASTHRLFP